MPGHKKIKKGEINISPFNFNQGQELVEFSLFILVLPLLLVGVIDLGRTFHALISISNAAREGARYGSLHYVTFDSDLNTYVADEPEIRKIVRQEAQNSAIIIVDDQDHIPVEVTQECRPGAGLPCSQTDTFYNLRVTVFYEFQPFLNILFKGVQIPLTRAAEIMIPFTIHIS